MTLINNFGAKDNIFLKGVTEASEHGLSPKRAKERAEYEQNFLAGKIIAVLWGNVVWSATNDLIC